ncbi:MAG TPA: ABC transporter permease subunit [Egibacteraceae bacterium]|nr:ABC transporter permease subunit [Egibacteraceae bacterium]
MAVAAPPTTSARPPFWRDARVLRWAFQIVVLLAVLALLYWLYNNVVTNLRASRLPRGFGFLDQPYGSDIRGSAFRPAQPIRDAFVVGYFNTIRVIAVGIPAATIIGIVVGISRLSDNALVRAFGTLYVEVLRNIPPLVWIFLTYFVILTGNLPPITEALEPLGLAVFSNRGIYLPWFEGGPNLVPFLLTMGLGLGAGVVVAAWRTRVNERTGQPHRRVLWLLVTFAIIAAAGYFIFGGPVAGTIPGREGRLIQGGIEVNLSYAALTFALLMYTASHIAEIVRGAILAVHKGQNEAANALALTTFQRYRFVILPQAFRIMIPPLASQYLNITKNSSLAVVVGYYEITRVYQTVTNNAAPPPQAIIVLMALYLTFSLGISLIANIINRRLQLETR